MNSGLLYGECLFESLPVYGGTPLFLGDHLGRLARGCKFMGWRVPPKSDFQRAIRLFSMAQGKDGDFLIRFNLVQEMGAGAGPRSFPGGVPVLFASIRPLGHDRREAEPRRGKAGLGPWRAADGKTLPNRFKYPAYLTTRETFRKHPQWTEILRLDRRGQVVDGGASTPLWFDGKRLHLPPLDLGGLEGVNRRKVLRLCSRAGEPAVERPWKPRDLFRGGKRGLSELIFVGSGAGVLSASHLMGRALPGAPKMASRLWRVYREDADRAAGDRR